MRESLRLEKEAHAATRAELDQSRARVAALEALLCNVGDAPTEPEDPVSEPRGDQVRTSVEV